MIPLTKRISELMNALAEDIPEREFCIQLGFLSMFVGEPFYLYGRSGSGKSLIIDRLVAAFKNAKSLKIGSRDDEIPENLDSYDIIAFTSYDPRNENTKANVVIALEDSKKSSMVISGDLRPEVALNRGEITDKITLTVALPDSISSNALCALLKTQGDVTSTHVSPGLSITNEEKNSWNEEIKKVALSEDTLKVIAEIAEVCDKNNIYVSIHKWIALTNIIKAAAFFNGRMETRLTDTFFLGDPIWGRSVSNNVIMENYREIVLKNFLKEIPEVLENPYDADDLLKRVHKLLNSSNNTYDTKLFNNEQCVFYRITIAGETVPLYAPLRYMETSESFHPYNELRQEEMRVICNYNGTSFCTISVDTAVKSSGLRNSTTRASTSNLASKFEDFGVFPTPILIENDPEVIERKKRELAEIRQEIQQVAEKKTKDLQTLKEVFAGIKTSKDDLFCNKEFFNNAQKKVMELFDQTKIVVGKVKEAHDTLAAQGL